MKASVKRTEAFARLVARRQGKVLCPRPDARKVPARDVWAWLQDGAHFYICGDAKRMAKDVERALADIACAHGGLTPDKGATFIADLKKAKRFQADVY